MAIEFAPTMSSPSGPSARKPHRDLPSGTVTFLFTDVEGSTRLLLDLGDSTQYAGVLKDYQHILEVAIEERGGYIIDATGDSVFAAFPRARDAIAASIGAQRAIRAHHWPDRPLAVRMGLHTGEPTVTAGGYVGLDVYRAARICAAAHGGQILLSQLSLTLVMDDLPEGVMVQDLGPYRLKDLQRPEHLYQVRHPELPADFPPVRALDALPHNLPIQLTSFVGRENEVPQVIQLLSSARLVTLVGPGGSGKTRLALHVGANLIESYSHGVWFVDLASIGDPELVPQMIAAALRVSEELGTAARQGPSEGNLMLATLEDYLQPRHLLLILDNCEHVISACARIAQSLLQAAPKLQILGTSRETLRISGETTWKVGPLDLPAERNGQSADALLRYSAVRLFVERAMAVAPKFALTVNNARAIAQICRRLDGIPLAIELAAARVKVLTPEQIESRLNDRFHLLTSGRRTALPHQHTLQATMDWSYDLLDPYERTVFRRLSVFAGGFGLEAMEALCSDDKIDKTGALNLLAHLVDKSLVVVEESPAQPRYHLLETVRQYSLEKLLDSGEEPRLRERHRDWYLALAERAEPELHGPRQLEWLEQLEQEHDNLRAAMEWSLAVGEEDEALRLAGAMWWFWHVRGHFTAGREWSERALARGRNGADTARGKASRTAGLLAWAQSDYVRAGVLGEESLALCRQGGDARGAATALTLLGLIAHRLGEHERAVALYEESLRMCRETGDTWTEAMDLLFLGEVSLHWQAYERADGFYADALRLFEHLGDMTGMAYGLYQSGLAARRRGDFAAATTLFDQALALFRETGNKGGIVFSFTMLGRVAHNQGDHARALALFEQSLELSRELGYKSGIAYSLLQLGVIMCHLGDLSHAADRLREALVVQRALGNHRGILECLTHLAAVAARQGQADRAARLFGVAYAMLAGLSIAQDMIASQGYADEVRAVRETLTPAEFDVAWNWGRAASLEQALAYAMESTGP